MRNRLLIGTMDLRVHFAIDEGILKAVDGVSLQIYTGKTIGLVGESGCGKSVTSQALLRIVPPPGTIKGKILFYRTDADEGNPLNLATLPPDGEVIRSIRGKEIAMIFQEPMTSFSPLYTMGNQIEEAIKLHRAANSAQAHGIAVEMLRRVGIACPEKRINEYPHEFSGGMRQRAMIAMALSCHPQLLIADEPTTALDVTIQAQVLELMSELQKEFGMGILFITHDLGVVAEMCDDVAVMYLGKIVEQAPVDDIFHNPLHPYTRGLLNSLPQIGKGRKKRLESIQGSVPVPLGLPTQCGFYDRCPMKIEDLCSAYAVPMAQIDTNHWVRCFQYDQVKELHEAQRTRA